MVTDNPGDNRFYICEQGQSQSSMIIPYQEHKITWVPSISMNEYLNDDPIDHVWIGMFKEQRQMFFLVLVTKLITLDQSIVKWTSDQIDNNSTLRTVIELFLISLSRIIYLNENEVCDL